MIDDTFRGGGSSMTGTNGDQEIHIDFSTYSYESAEYKYLPPPDTPPPNNPNPEPNNPDPNPESDPDINSNPLGGLVGNWSSMFYVASTASGYDQTTGKFNFSIDCGRRRNEYAIEAVCLVATDAFGNIIGSSLTLNEFYPWWGNPTDEEDGYKEYSVESYYDHWPENTLNKQRILHVYFLYKGKYYYVYTDDNFFHRDGPPSN